MQTTLLLKKTVGIIDLSIISVLKKEFLAI